MRNDKAIREEVANGVLHAVDNVCMNNDDRTVANVFIKTRGLATLMGGDSFLITTALDIYRAGLVMGQLNSAINDWRRSGEMETVANVDEIIAAAHQTQGGDETDSENKTWLAVFDTVATALKQAYAAGYVRAIRDNGDADDDE